MRRLVLCTLAALTLASTANAAVPAWAWWTPSQAGRNVVHANPQLLTIYKHDSTITTASCAGVRPATKAHGVRRFHVFKCSVSYTDDTAGTGETKWPFPLYVATSTKKRAGLACFDRSLGALKAKRCI